MATQIITTLIDSINGSTEGVETVTFFHPMTGQKMTIELDVKNRKAMGTHLERMNKYFDAAEPVVEEVPVSKPKAAAKNDENARIREWAKDNDYTIGDRGRIKAEIIDAYRKAQDAINNPDTDAQVAGDEPVTTEQVKADVADADQAETDALIDEATVGLGSLIDEVDSRQDEAEASMDAYDAEHGTVSEDDVLSLMKELEAEGSELSLKNLQQKVDSGSKSE